MWAFKRKTFLCRNKAILHGMCQHHGIGKIDYPCCTLDGMGCPHQRLEHLLIVCVTLQFQQPFDDFRCLVFRLNAEKLQHGNVG